jgi:2-oxo-4-hydroxy-4-carboxy--5-ureidoimidazoline (OHCU) decarboxylase
MEMAIAEMATAQKAAETSTAVSVAVLKQAQQAGGAEALALLQGLPDVAPSASGIGDTVDISV